MDEYPHTRLPAYPPTHTPAFHSEIRNPKPEIIRLVEFLQAFEPLERASIERVVEKGFLAGLTKATLREIGQNVVRNKTVDATLHALRARGVEIEVLSANWSTALIEGAMEGCCDHVIANCLVYDETGVSTGDIQLRVVSAQDKLRWFRQRRAQPGQTLYIGDSISDLLAILDADIGILIGNNRIAMWTIERFSLPTQRLTKKTQFDPTLRYQGTILLVESWEALTGFILGASSGVSQPGLTSV